MNQDTTTQRVFSNTAVQAIGRIVIMLAGLASVTLLTRHLGVQGYGAYTAASVFLSFFISLSDWGIPTILARDLAQEGKDAGRMVNTVAIGRVLLAVPSALLAAVLAFLIYPNSPEISTAIAILSLTLISNALIATFAAYFQSRLAMQFPTLAEVAARLITLALIVWVVMNQGGLNLVMAVGVIGSIVQAGLLWLFIRRELPQGLDFDYPLFRRIFLASLPLGAAVILNAIYFKVDALMLSLLRPISDVGIYGVAYKALELILILPSLFGASLLPVLSRQALDLPKFRGVVQRSLEFMMLLAIPIFSGGLVVAPGIISVIGGQDFTAAALPLQILLAAAVFTFINILNGLAVIAINRQKEALWVNVVGLILNILLNLILIPRYGFVAAAIVTLMSEIFVTTANFYILQRYAQFRPGFDRIPQALVAALTMMLVLMFVPLGSIFIQIAVGAAVYFVMLILLRGLRVQEIYEVIGIAKPD